jgi:hypothetical protein
MNVTAYHAKYYAYGPKDRREVLPARASFSVSHRTHAEVHETPVPPP